MNYREASSQGDGAQVLLVASELAAMLGRGTNIAVVCLLYLPICTIVLMSVWEEGHSLPALSICAISTAPLLLAVL